MVDHVLIALHGEDLTPKSNLMTYAQEKIARPDSDYTVVHVVETTPDVQGYLGPDFQAVVNKALEDRLADLRKWAMEDPDRRKIVVRYGRPYREIVEVAKKMNARHLVIGYHDERVTDYLLGTNAANIVRHAPCSVTVLRPDG